MRRLGRIALVVAVILSLWSCEEKETPESGQMVVNLSFGTADVSLLEGQVIEFKVMSDDGIVHTSVQPVGEQVSMTVSSGVYNVMASMKFAKDNVVHLYSGTLSEVVLCSGESVICDMEMVYSQSGQVVISELYYSGCVGGSGETYIHDQYLILHNNSSDTAYLDGLCIAYVMPMRATSKWGFVEAYEDRSVVGNFIWQFPGEGQENPIAPGADVVVAPNCVNHVALGNEESVDLSKEGYWACYDVNAKLTKQSSPATPDKKMLNLIWRYGSVTSCIGSILDPAYVLFKIKGDRESYLDEYATYNPNNPSSSTIYMGVPYAWIYDGVECFDAANRYKRLASVVDGGYALMSEGSASGTSVRRKIDEQASAEMGFIVYQDTNNSLEDFEPCYPPTLKE